MPNTLFFVHTAWVKNVYSLRTSDGTTGVLLSTGSWQSNNEHLTPVHNSPVIRSLVHQFITYLSTAKIPIFNLLYSHLYPQSTTPINKRNKEK
jgi:hypothetical protein